MSGRDDSNLDEVIANGARALSVVSVLFAIVVIVWLGGYGESCCNGVNDAWNQIRRMELPRPP